MPVKVNWTTIGVGALITATVPVLEALVMFNPDAIADWRTWVVGIGAGSVRQVASYLLARIAEARVTSP